MIKQTNQIQDSQGIARTKKSKYKKNSMECKNQKLFEGSEPTKHIKVKKYKKQIFSMDCRNKKIMRIASNKQIKVSTLNSNYDKYMCLINFFHLV